MGWLLLSGRLVLASVFGVAGVGKAFDPTGSQKAISDFGSPGLFVKPVAFLLPVAEFSTTALLLWTSAAFWGAAAALALLLAFTIVITANMVKGRRPECHCFGQFHSRPISWATVTRNFVLAIGAAGILWEGPGMSEEAAARQFAEIARAHPLVVAALSLGVTGFLFQMFLLLALFQQHGRLILRMDTLERGAAGGGPLAPTPPALAGLPVGRPAPSFELSPANSGFTLDTLLVGRKPVLLVFTDPDCQASEELLPEIQRWERQYMEMITFVIISRASLSAKGQLGRKYVFTNVAWQKDHEISESYRIGGVPAAVVVRPDATIGTWVASGRAAIQSLVAFLLYTRLLVVTNEEVTSPFIRGRPNGTLL
jgi:uncharacterized membrane protein YphA (DoxX/SURF4 family)